MEFWGSRHGKGPHDEARACLKQALRKEQLEKMSQKLQNAADVVDFLQHAMNIPNNAYPLAKRVVERHFYLIGANEVSRKHPMACKTVDGSRSIHSIWSVGTHNNCLLETLDFSCFCDVYMHGSPGICSDVAYVVRWRFVTMEPMATKEAMQETEDLHVVD
ncbi:hypothetical protein KC19_VG148800 [Ceratodon purpureus]|uniref:Uncharacterized protein n=1 Tax=Ceratodon purpureus TaxID=3225 RepID=A0A8T0HQ65_CERPU|nr:hypothetical protein KC19_VG148800 [Ceratodon purpureus]